MIIRYFHIYFLTLLIISLGFSLAPATDQGGSISGHIYDSEFDVPLEYTNILLYDQENKMQVGGTSTGSTGDFNLAGIQPGNYTLEIYFLGYDRKIFNNLIINSQDKKIDLGSIPLQQTALTMDNVLVEGEKPPMSYQIDKKVISVDHQQTAISGSAVDVLENVPSVSVDIEGNVSLRGSSNFTVLIDGRPTVLEPSDALRQLPASTIENIEIITNPSAKYNPEGESGIINIIMKKNSFQGMSGLVNMNAGMNDRYGGDFLYEYRTNKYSATISLDYNQSYYDGANREENRTSHQGIHSFIYSNGNSLNGWISSGVRGSLTYSLSQNDQLTFDGRYGDGNNEGESDFIYSEWTDLIKDQLNYNSLNNRERGGNYYSLNLNYSHRFQKKGHELSAQLYNSYRNGDEFTLNELHEDGNGIISGQKSVETGPSTNFRIKLDYTLPLGKENKFEAGYQSEISNSEDNTALYEFNRPANQYQLLDQYSHTTNYDRTIHAGYLILATKWNKLGYQAGLRGEYTDRMVELSGDTKAYKIDRIDYFPTLHISYGAQDGQQMMASYTRRIDRPRGYYLEPFETWMDAYNVRKGNPGLSPQYIDSYEFGYQTFLGNNLLSTELYYRRTNNKVERVRSVYENNITLHLVENVGKDYSLGSEFLLNTDLSKKWNINFLGNFYRYRIEGILNENRFSRESYNWGLRLNNILKFTENLQLQLNGRYNSPTVSSQGRREGYFSTDIALKKDFWEKKLSATLQVRDVFGTRDYEYYSEGPDFYTYNYASYTWPNVMLNIRYNLNNYKVKREGNRDNGDLPSDEF